MFEHVNYVSWSKAEDDVVFASDHFFDFVKILNRSYSDMIYLDQR